MESSPCKIFSRWEDNSTQKFSGTCSGRGMGGSVWTGGVISTAPEPYELALSAEKCIHTRVHICVFHILARNAKS